MLKGRVSKNLSGAICIPTVSQQAMVANSTFEIEEDKFWSADIQKALQSKKIVFLSKTPSSKEKVVLTNISEGSISVPGHGIVRTATSIIITKDDAKRREVKKLFDSGKIALDKKRQHVKSSNKMPTAVIIEKRKGKQKSKDFNPITWSPKEESSSTVENDTSDKDGISWVDLEQTNDRLKSHPILGKKYAKNNHGKG